jgi:hypothetical protein
MVTRAKATHPSRLVALIAASAIALLAACGGGGNPGACTVDPDCPEGRYCGPAGACTFDCREDSDCPAGTCNSFGKCTARSPDAGVPDARPKPDARRDVRPPDLAIAADLAQASVKVTKIELPALFPGDKFPTSLAHLIGSPALKSPLPLARVSLKNYGTATASAVSVEVQLAGFSAAASKTVTLAPGAADTVELTPSFDLAKLFAQTTEVPANVTTTVRWNQGVVFQDTHQVSILGRNAFYLQLKDPYSAVFVTPSDKAGSINKLLASAAQKMPGKQMVGYQALTAKSLTASIAVASWYYESIYLLAGHKICGKLDLVTGGVDADIDVYAIDAANYALFAGGQTAVALLKLPNALTGASFCFTAAAQGWHYLVYYNTPDNFVGRAVTRTRDASHHEVAKYQAEAIYGVLKDQGMAYVNAPGGTTWWSGVQTIKYPAETIADKAGNCIDGTLVFASAFEAMGMRPVILYAPGHAFVGVRMWTTEDIIVPVETTMVGTSSFDQAYVKAVDEIDQNNQAGTLWPVDIATARPLGVSPAPM